MRKQTVFAMLAMVALLGGGCSKSGSVGSGSREGNYAVFLSNNQVYFGMISAESDQWLTMKRIFYIPSNASTESGDLSLTKLGKELHGPEDQLEINRDHILFIEKLREDGKVSHAIQNFVEKK